MNDHGAQMVLELEINDPEEAYDPTLEIPDDELGVEEAVNIHQAEELFCLKCWSMSKIDETGMIKNYKQEMEFEWKNLACRHSWSRFNDEEFWTCQ